uniref:DUF2177 family protein n=1 Tax=viral metagenome TaxID=1070528 RepID=A0A6C0DCM2_9ZZZZ
MTQFIKKILISTVVLLILDALYIYVNKNVFQDVVVNIQRVVMKIKLESALFVYLLLVIVINYFIIQKNRTPLEAFILGFCIYGIYDGTNYAMFKKWPLNVALMDATWGGILFSATTYITYILLNLQE